MAHYHHIPKRRTRRTPLVRAVIVSLAKLPRMANAKGLLIWEANILEEKRQNTLTIITKQRRRKQDRVKDLWQNSLFSSTLTLNCLLQ
jgi:hypothetical protein